MIRYVAGRLFHRGFAAQVSFVGRRLCIILNQILVALSDSKSRFSQNPIHAHHLITSKILISYTSQHSDITKDGVYSSKLP